MCCNQERQVKVVSVVFQVVLEGLVVQVDLAVLNKMVKLHVVQVEMEALDLTVALVVWVEMVLQGKVFHCISNQLEFRCLNQV